MKKHLYLISPKIKWKTYKLLQEKLVHDSGPSPKQINRVFWGMIQDRKILAWFAGDMKDDMGLGTKIPERYKKWKIFILS